MYGKHYRVDTMVKKTQCLIMRHQFRNPGGFGNCYLTINKSSLFIVVFLSSHMYVCMYACIHDGVWYLLCYVVSVGMICFGV